MRPRRTCDGPWRGLTIIRWSCKPFALCFRHLFLSRLLPGIEARRTCLLFGGRADIPDRLADVPLMTQSGHRPKRFGGEFLQDSEPRGFSHEAPILEAISFSCPLGESVFPNARGHCLGCRSLGKRDLLDSSI